jgi:phage-related protein
MSLETNILIGFNAQQALSGFPQVANAATQMGAKVEASGQSFQQLSSQANSSKSALAGLGSSYQQASSSAQQSSSATTAFTGALRGVQSGASTAGQSASSAGQAFTGLAGSTNTANTATKTYTGALTGLNSSLGPVQGGLTKTNTVTQQLGTSAEATAVKQKNLTTSVTGAATGFAGLAATGVSLFNMYDRLGDAEFNVQAAQNALTKIQISAATTQNRINKLAAEGKQGSAEYAIQVDKLRLLHERLPVAQNNVANAQEDLNKAYAEFAGNIIPTVIQGASSAVLLFTSLRGAGTAAGIGEAAAAAGATAAAGAMEAEAGAAGTAAVATGGLSTALLALAAPIAAAVALFALIETNTFGMGDAFRSTVTVIGAGVDGIINAITELWNGFVGLLNNLSGFGADVNNMIVGVENSFINVFNGIITATNSFLNTFRSGWITLVNFFTQQIINPIIGGWNNFLFGLESSGTATKDKVVGVFADLGVKVVDAMLTLVKGLNSAFSAIGVKTFQPAVDGLEGFKKTLVTTAQTSTQSADQARKAWQGGIPTLDPINQSFGQLNLKTIDAAKGAVNAGQAYHAFDFLLRDANSTIGQSIAQSVNFYSSWGNVSHLLQGQVSPAIIELIKHAWDSVAGFKEMIAKALGLQQAAAAAGGQIKQNTGDIQTNTNAAGENSNALKKLQDDTAKQTNELNTLNDGLSKGTVQWEAYQNGMVKTNLEFAQNEQKIAESEGQLESLNEHLRDGTATWQAYRQGITDADLEYDKFITSSVQAGAKQLELNNLLRDAADSFGGLPGFIEPTIQNLEAFIKAGMSLTGTLRDSGQAFKEFEDLATKSWNNMIAAGQDFFKKLIDSARKGGTDMVKGFDDAMQDLPPAVWENLTAADEQALKAGALFAAAGQNAAQLFSIKLQSGINQGMDFNTAVGYAKQAAIDMVQQFVDQNPQMAAEGQQFISALTNATGTGIQQVLQQFSSMPGPIGQMANQMLQAYQSQGMDPMTTSSQTTATNATTALTSIQNAGQTFGTIATLFQQQIEQTLPRMATNAATGVTTAFDTISTTAIGILSGIANAAQSIFQTVGQAANAAVGPVSAAFNRISTTAIGVLSGIANAAQSIFARVGQAANAAVGPVAAAFTRISTTAIGVLSGIMTAAQSAFNAVGSAGTQAGTRVSSGMQAIQQSAQRAMQQVQQLANQINSLRDKRVTITVYVDLTGPGVGYLQHGGVLYAQHGAVIDSTTKPPFITDRRMKRGNAVIGEFGKPELVLPLSKHPGDVADKQIAIKNQYARGLGGGSTGAGGSGGGGEKQEVSVKGRVSNNQPINVYLDGRKIMSTVQRQLLEFSDATV